MTSNTPRLISNISLDIIINSEEISLRFFKIRYVLLRQHNMRHNRLLHPLDRIHPNNRTSDLGVHPSQRHLAHPAVVLFRELFDARDDLLVRCEEFALKDRPFGNVCASRRAFCRSSKQAFLRVC
jgi:hypothetical protein